MLCNVGPFCWSIKTDVILSGGNAGAKDLTSAWNHLCR